MPLVYGVSTDAAALGARPTGSTKKAALVTSGGLVSDMTIRGVTSVYQIEALCGVFRVDVVSQFSEPPFVVPDFLA